MRISDYVLRSPALYQSAHFPFVSLMYVGLTNALIRNLNTQVLVAEQRMNLAY